MSTRAQNRLESQYAGINLEGQPHALSAWFVVLLRAMIGGMILFAGLGKYAFVPGGEAFDAGGYLANVDAVSPASGLFALMAESALFMEFVNVIVPLTQVLIGLALITGAFVRLAALGGAMQMALFYLGGWPTEWLAIFDSTLIYMVVFLAVAAFGAGRILGLDKHIEQLDIGGEPLIEKYPAAKYILG